MTTVLGRVLWAARLVLGRPLWVVWVALVACDRAGEASPSTVALEAAASRSSPPASAAARTAAPEDAGGAGGAPGSPAAPRRSTVARFDAAAADDWLARAAPEDVGLDGRALDALVERAVASDSDSLVVVADGRLVVERYFDRARGPIETRSITKSFAMLGVLGLVADGRIASLDEPLSTWLPELARPDAAAVTLRHVLTHTTGMARDRPVEALNAADDRLAYARALGFVEPPGRRFFYSNEASQLLSGVIAAAAGEPADAYVRRRILAPLGIGERPWAHDRAGNVQTYYGLGLEARDLVRVGMLLLDEGRFEGEAVLPAELVRQAVAPSAVNPAYGLLLWLRTRFMQSEERLATLGAAGMPGDALRALLGRRFATEEAYLREADARLPEPARRLVASLQRAGRGPLVAAPGGQVGFFAVGAEGQRLAVYPAARLVVVRQHRHRAADAGRLSTITWRSFLDDLEPLVPGLAVESGAPSR